MARSKITIMNMALAASGQPGKQVTPASTGGEYALMDQFYPEIVGAAFEDGDFHFGKERVTLDTRSAGDFGKNDAWLLPDDVLHIIAVFVNDYATEDWEIDGTHLYIDASSNVEMEYVKQGSEHLWSSKLVLGIVGKLEAILRRSINEEYEEGRDTDKEANFQIQMAGTHSSKQRGPRRPFKRGFLMRTRRYGPQRFWKRGEK